jgi:hypothetical protein
MPFGRLRWAGVSLPALLREANGFAEAKRRHLAAYNGGPLITDLEFRE